MGRPGASHSCIGVDATPAAMWISHASLLTGAGRRVKVGMSIQPELMAEARAACAGRRSVKAFPAREMDEKGIASMDVGMMMVFASYGWENCSDERVWDEEIRLARTRRRSGLRLPLVGRAPLQRLLVRAGQHPAHDLSDGHLPEYRSRHGRRDPALARSAAGRRTGRGAGQSVQGPVSFRHGPRPRPPRIRRLPSEHGRIARALRRGGADDRQGTEDRLHRRRRASTTSSRGSRSGRARSIPSTAVSMPWPPARTRSCRPPSSAPTW